MFTGSTSTLPAEPEAEKTLLQKSAEMLWRAANLFERHQNESRRHGPLDPGHQHEPDFGQRIRETEGDYTNWGNDNRMPPETLESKLIAVLIKAVVSLFMLGLTGWVGFVSGRVWDHEHRISVLEGKEVPNARSP
jgi:hypothetical protein